MAELNKFQFYSYNGNSSLQKQKDEVDQHVEFLNSCDNYDEVRNYLVSHFGDIKGERWVEIDSCKKECYLNFEDSKIEFCCLKNHKQYYGKGWLKLNKE